MFFTCKKIVGLLLAAAFTVNCFGVSFVNFTAFAAGKVNLALDTAVEVSSWEQDYGGFPAENLTDGNYNHDSRWATAGGQTEHWAIIDFGESLRFDQVVLYEDYRYGKRINDFDIEYWNGSAWVLAADNSATDPPDMDSSLGDYHYEARVFDNTFPAVTAQKVRIFFTEYEGDPAVREVEIFNSGNLTEDGQTADVTIGGTISDEWSVTIPASVTVALDDGAPQLLGTISVAGRLLAGSTINVDHNRTAGGLLENDASEAEFPYTLSTNGTLSGLVPGNSRNISLTITDTSDYNTAAAGIYNDIVTFTVECVPAP